VLKVLEDYCSTNCDEDGYNQREATMIPWDEVLKEIAVECVSSVIPLIGEEFNTEILVFLQKLAVMEEVAVRKAAIEGLVSCAVKFQGSFVDKELFPVIRTLASARQ